MEPKGERARAAAQYCVPEAGTTAVLMEQVHGMRTTAELAAQSEPRATVRMPRDKSPGMPVTVYKPDGRSG